MTTRKENSAERTNTKNCHDRDHIPADVAPAHHVVVVGQNNGEKQTLAKIQKVPRLLRSNASHSNCYDPTAVSIGPYHHGKSEFKEVEDLKPQIKCKFVKDSGEEEAQFYKKIVEVADEARKCYAEGSIDESISDEKFKHMMLLDGCFVLQFIHCFVEDKYEELGMKLFMVSYVQRDLLLLENQLPFIVLDALMSLRFEKKPDGMKMIHKFLHLSRCLPTPEDTYKLKGPFVHLIDIMVRQLIVPKALKKNSEYHHVISYRSAKELTNVGIRLRASNSFQFTDVHFYPHPFMASLTLPPILVDDTTKAKLLNMVAYETCPDAPDHCGVTSYIWFLDSLIDNAEDVKELRSKRILFNYLGSDEQVAQLFNEMSNGLVFNAAAFVDVQMQIEKHYGNRVKIWIADWIHEHFTTPWTVLAFAGAILALILSVIQTYFAANPPK